MKRMKRYAKNLYRFLPVSLAAVLCAVSFVCAAETPGGNAGQDGIPQAVHWYDEYVACATERGWIGLLEDGTFGAEEPMTRAVFVSALYQMKQETEGAESMPAMSGSCRRWNGRRNRRSSMELTVISVRIRRSIARRWLS